MEEEESVIARTSQPRSVSPIQHTRKQLDASDIPVAPSIDSAARPSSPIERELSKSRAQLPAKHHSSNVPEPMLQQATARMPPPLPPQPILSVPPPLPPQPIARIPPPLPTQGMSVPPPLPTSINANANNTNRSAPIAMGGLLAEIRAGKALKKVAQTRKTPSKNVRKKAGGGGGIMAQMLQRQREMKAKQRQKKGGRRFTGIGEDTVNAVETSVTKKSLKQKSAPQPPRRRSLKGRGPPTPPKRSVIPATGIARKPPATSFGPRGGNNMPPLPRGMPRSLPMSRPPPPLPLNGRPPPPLPLPTNLNPPAPRPANPPAAFGSLLAEIQRGKKLKSVQTKAKQSSNGNGAKSNSKSKGPAIGGGGLMAAILKRQQKIKSKGNRNPRGKRLTGIDF